MPFDYFNGSTFLIPYKWKIRYQCSCMSGIALGIIYVALEILNLTVKLVFEFSDWYFYQIYNQSQYNKRSIHKAILNGTKSLVYYPSNPLMIPKGLTPVCHKMHLTVQTDYKVSRKNKPSSLPKNSRPTLGQSITETKTGICVFYRHLRFICCCFFIVVALVCFHPFAVFAAFDCILDVGLGIIIC